VTARTPGRARGKDRAYVFLICTERCGSNLISAMLGAHSKVASPPPFHFARDVAMNWRLRGDPDAWAVVRAQLLHRVTMLESEERAAVLSAWMDAHPQASAGELARFVYAGLDPKAGATTVFVKENNLHRVMTFILEAFPDAKFVFQVRDPRDYLASAQARRGFWGGNKFGSNRHALEVWRNDQLGGLAILGLLGPERVFFQRYEDLVSRPREVLEPLCAFLGLKFEAAMLSFHESDEARRLGDSGSARANVGKPLMAGNFGKYRQQLSGGQIRMVETWVGDLMDELGYGRDLVAPGKTRGLRTLGPQLTEPFERLINGEVEPFYTTGQKRFLRKLRGTAPAIRPAYDRDR